MKTKDTFLILAAVILSCNLLSAQDKSKYYDPARFYTLNAAHRSDDGRARVVSVPVGKNENRPLLQILTADGKIVSSDGFKRFGKDCESKDLRSLKTKDGNTVYLYIQGKTTFGDEGAVSSDWVSAFRLGKDGKMEQVPIFKTSKALLKEIICDWRDGETIDGCYDELESGFNDDEYYANSLGITYYAKSSSIYVPLIEKTDNNPYFDLKYTNRFLVYQFDGNVFVFKGREAPYWLHPSLKDFQNTEYCFMTRGRFLVQVDKMKDGSYRYAAWNNAGSLKDLARKPDLVLGGGSCINGERYTFRNNNYKYVVDSYLSTLVVEKNGEVILETDIF